MKFRRVHWLSAGAAALSLHACVLIGLRSQAVGAASPPPGPIIAMATSLPGIVGSAVEEIENEAPDTKKETKESNEAVEPKTQERDPTKTKRKTDQANKKQQRRRASRSGNVRKGSAGARRGGGGRASSAGAINRYAMLVRARILSRRPRSAARRGTTVVVFQLSSSGGLSWARVGRSSGNQSLDQKSLASLRRASPFPRPPAGARASQLRFSIRFHFR